MSKFKGAVLVEQNKPLMLVELKHVAPLKGQVKVKMITAGLCGAQINEIDGVKGPDKFLPHMMGHEGFGLVDCVGDGVSNLKTGDYVVLHWRPGVGMNVFGGVYQHEELGQIGSGPVTTFSEYSIVSENRCSKVSFDKNLLNVYPLLGCALSTAYGLVNVELSLQAESRVLISGGGGLGLSIASILKAKGVNCVHILEKNTKKRELLVDFSSFISDDLNDFDIDQYDFIFDTTGNVEVLRNLFASASKNTDIILVGQPRVGSQLLLFDPLKLFDNVRIFATQGGKFDPSEHMEGLNKLVKEKRHIFEKLISHSINLSEVNKGFEMMRSGEAKRIIIKFGQCNG
jgi:S-(hydroxymethyl)glutathione dehydrogenase/alcohol dehydrogenase